MTPSTAVNRVKALRTMAITQWILLVLCGSSVLQHTRLQRDLMLLERAYLAHVLMHASCKEAGDSDKDATWIEGGSREKFDDDLGTYFAFADRGEVEALGQFMAYAGWQLFHRIPLSTGGWLYYTNGGIETQDVRRVDDTESPKDEENGDERREIFVMSLLIQEHSEILGGEIELKFSNLQKTYRPEYLGWDVKPGALTVSFDGETFHDAASLRSEILRIGRVWGCTSSGDVEHPYRELRSRFEQAEVELPILDTSVSTPWAMAILAVLSVSVAAGDSFMLRSLREQSCRSLAEGCLAVESIIRFPCKGVLSRVAALLEFPLFQVFYCVPYIAPILVTAALFHPGLKAQRPVRLWLCILVFFLSFSFAISMISNHLAVIALLTKEKKIPAISDTAVVEGKPNMAIDSDEE